MQNGWISVRVMSIFWYYDIVTFEYCNTRPVSWTLFVVDLFERFFLDIFYVSTFGGHIQHSVFVCLFWDPMSCTLCFAFNCWGAHFLYIVFVDLLGSISWTFVFNLFGGPYHGHVFYIFGVHILTCWGSTSRTFLVLTLWDPRILQTHTKPCKHMQQQETVTNLIHKWTKTT